MAKPKLNEVVAVATGRKSGVQKAITEAYHKIQKEALFDGISRTYKPRDEQGEQLPAERKDAQQRASEIVQGVVELWKDLFDITLTQDLGNCQARGTVTVDGQTILADIPVTTLLFLEKQLHDVETFIQSLPTPDPAERWNFDAQQDCLATEPFQTVRTKKVPKAFVKYEATKEHPAQVETFHEDVVVGDWTTIKYTARMPAQSKREALDRVKKLLDAVKVARERANALEIDTQKCGTAILAYVFGKA